MNANILSVYICMLGETKINESESESESYITRSNRMVLHDYHEVHCVNIMLYRRLGAKGSYLPL